MNWITDKINEGRERVSRTGILTTVVFIASLVLFKMFKEYYPSLQFLGVMTMLYSCGLGAFYVTDKYVFPNISFREQIEKGNMAVAVTFAAIFMFTGVCEMCAFAVFFTLR